MEPVNATVLVVDDDDAQREEVVEHMAEQFDRVLEAPSAEIALYACGAHAVDVVAASAQLPGMGADALRAELVDHDGPPLLAYDAPPDGSVRARWLDAGGADCMDGRDPVLVAARCRAITRRSPALAHRRGRRRRALGRGRRRVTPGVLRWR